MSVSAKPSLEQGQIWYSRAGSREIMGRDLVKGVWLISFRADAEKSPITTTEDSMIFWIRSLAAILKPEDD
jgi:hypothetical protein